MPGAVPGTCGHPTGHPALRDRRCLVSGGWTVHAGDCLEGLRGIPTASVDVVLTDPPCGINTKSDGRGKLNPWADLCNASHWYAAWISECRRALKPTGCLWTFLNWRSLVTFQKASCDLRWPIASMLVWDKGWIGPGGHAGLRPSYELVALWAMPEFQITDRGLPDVQQFKWSGHKPTGHPAEKPVALLEWILRASNVDASSYVVDPFCGSGSTLVAASGLGARASAFEIDPVWADAAKSRVASDTAQNGLFDPEARP